jgi:hypothetical protein
VIMRSDLLEYCCHHHNVIWSILGYLLSLYCYILNGASYRRRAIRSIQRCLLCAQSWVVIVISSGQSQDVFSVYTLKVELSSSLMITMVLMLLGVWHVLAAQPPQLLAQVMTPGVNQWHSGFDGVQSLPSTITGLLFTRLVAGSRYAAHASGACIHYNLKLLKDRSQGLVDPYGYLPDDLKICHPVCHDNVIHESKMNTLPIKLNIQNRLVIMERECIERYAVFPSPIHLSNRTGPISVRKNAILSFWISPLFLFPILVSSTCVT